MSIRVLLRDQPHRAIALVTSTHALVLRHSPSTTDSVPNFTSTSIQQAPSNGGIIPRCIVEFSRLTLVDLDDYRSLDTLAVQGTLGLITVNNDVFLCVVNGASRVATVRPGETVQRIHSVAFHCLNRSDYDHILNDDINPYPIDVISQDGAEHGHGQGQGRREPTLEHPCLALKKLLSSGTFYYSVDFDLTKRLQDRSNDSSAFDVENLDEGFLWNSYMIGPLLKFRSRLAAQDREALDSSRILTSAIRGFVLTAPISASTSPLRAARSGLTSTLTLISRLSCRRAGTRFNSRGIDDDGNAANFVETETVFWSPSGVCFSYAQIRGSVPVFWEQATNLLPGQQKIQITRSPEATQPAFDKHFESLEVHYGAVHVLNLLSESKPGEVELTRRYRGHVQHSPLNSGAEKGVAADYQLLKETEFDFHAETKGPSGYEAASMVRHLIQGSADGFGYYMSEDNDNGSMQAGQQHASLKGSNVVLLQEGVFRTNCLDCLDRTNLIQTIISQMTTEAFLAQRGERASPDFWMRHSSLWADNGDSLSKIYAGTGALKSSFTRHGKMSFAGAIADARKSATRMYINNFADKGRQETIDMLLGRLMEQVAVQLYDPINDYVIAELNKRSGEYSASKPISIWVGTFNLNGNLLGRTHDMREDLSPWLCPKLDVSQQQPEIVAIGFQEIVELSPQHIMSTDPAGRQMWEKAVKRTLNEKVRGSGSEEYVLLRSGQLVGAALSIFVKANVLGDIKDVEGSVKKTGMSGMAGNKGAVAIRMDYASTRICFVTAHLAAGFANYEERNRDYRTINHGLRFQRNRSIEDHDTIIWLGDFNYRIGLSDEKVRKLMNIGDLETLYENDQLNLQMVAGLTFPFYSESRITFMPTYKFDHGTDNYDTSEKGRIPAWTDRILRKGTNLRQITYDSAPLRFSDHRPVYATFQCVVNVVNQSLKDAMSREIYDRRRIEVGDLTANTRLDDTDDEDLIGYDSIAPGLPPASSDRRKWWLDNGLPARSNIQAPGEEYVPNPQRPSNPFSQTTEPDWIQKPRAPAPRTTSIKIRDSSTSEGAPDQGAHGLRKLPPPYYPASSAASLPTSFSQMHSVHSSGRDLAIHSTSSEPRIAPLSPETTRKPAPPVPKKPTVLRTPSSQGSQMQGLNKKEKSNSPSDTVLDARHVSSYTVPGVYSDSVKFPPPPRKSTAAMSQIPSTHRVPDARQHRTIRPSTHDPTDNGPPLPPRVPSTNSRNNGVMDECDEDMQSMTSWEPLRPS
ncbi:MAG: inositol polyphosphate 5-phosphatase [Pycnora praestabilis]|nr:MAG: inositol polyphosphate 5-phosphatase [Pycnora praestabilis]